MKKRYFVHFLLLLSLSYIVFAEYTGRYDHHYFKSRKDKRAKHKAESLLGINLAGFTKHTGIIEKNEFLSDILMRYHLSYLEVDKMVKTSVTLFDVREIIAGNKYHVLTTNDSTSKARYFIYEKSPVEYIVFDFQPDSFQVYQKEKPIIKKTRTAAGTINTSLYESLIAQKLPIALAMELADIYAWTIDFYRIQKGDAFLVSFEEWYVEDRPYRIGEVKCANFVHGGESFYAFRYKQDSIVDYYDEKGNSMRKAFLKSPVKFSRISSHYTQRRFHPVQKRFKAHLGTDYAAPTGTPIMATGDGTVMEAGYKKYNGNYVKIRHNNTFVTQYLHMSKIGSQISAGKVVKQGQTIGYVGSTGLATGPHVCYRFWKNGQQVNHLREKFPASKPIKTENKQNFELTMVSQKTILDDLMPTIHPEILENMDSGYITLAPDDGTTTEETEE